MYALEDHSSTATAGSSTPPTPSAIG